MNLFRTNKKRTLKMPSGGTLIIERIFSDLLLKKFNKRIVQQYMLWVVYIVNGR